VPTAVKLGFGALPNIEARQDEFRRRLPEYTTERAGRTCRDRLGSQPENVNSTLKG
jgi:hypothetical protein